MATCKLLLDTSCALWRMVSFVKSGSIPFLKSRYQTNQVHREPALTITNRRSPMAATLIRRCYCLCYTLAWWLSLIFTSSLPHHGGCGIIYIVRDKTDNRWCMPAASRAIHWPEAIVDSSPQFAKIYKQGNTVESLIFMLPCAIN